LQLEQERVGNLHGQWGAESKKIEKILKSRKQGPWTEENGDDALDKAQRRRAEFAREVIAGKIGLLPLLRSELKDGRGSRELENQIKESTDIAEKRLKLIREQIQENQEWGRDHGDWVKGAGSAPGEGRAVDMRTENLVKLKQEQETIVKALGYEPKVESGEFLGEQAA